MQALGSPAPLTLEDFDYELPAERIAQEPLPKREDSRLMVLPARAERPVHDTFRNLGRHLRPGDLLVLNDTRVVPARLACRRATGGRVDGLVLGAAGGGAGRFHAFLQSRGRLREGEVLAAEGDAASFRLVAKGERGRWTLEIVRGDLGEALRAAGRAPLPPYIRRDAVHDVRDDADLVRYQTVFARVPGAVAAPTAGLHFTEALLSGLTASGIDTAHVTLHVGPGTFLPVRSSDLDAHRMEPEAYAIPEATARKVDAARREGRRVIAVGTTACRALEGSLQPDGTRSPRGSTGLFIRPPFRFRQVDALVTNFHMPCSTLLMLVAAFAGRERILAAYREALVEGYRFLSYGDAMLVFPDPASGAAERGGSR